MRIILRQVFFFIFIGNCFLANAQEAFLPNQYLVQCRYQIDFLKAMEQKSITGAFPALIQAERLSPNFNVWLITTAPSDETSNLKKLQSFDFIELAQLNHVVSLRETTPNDPNFTQQYSLKNTGQNSGTVGADIDATLAWDVTTGGVTALGDTIVVAVIDGGAQLNHPDLAANIWFNNQEIPGNGIDDDNNGYIDDINGWNAYNNSGTIPNDQHGTHVSGIIGARSNNATGVSGVNWNVKIMEVGGSSGSESTVVAAYLYIATQRKLYNQTNGTKGAYVVSTNSSFGVDYGQASNFPIWCAMYDTLGKYGVISCGATINGNVNVDEEGDIPTTCASNFLISVTNSNRNDTKLGGAGFGLVNIDLASPGTDVYNTVNNNGYSALTGTSMATPHVAGVLALMYAAACQQLILDARINPELIALNMRQFIIQGADVLPSMANFVGGSGRLNAFGAIQQVQSYICDQDVPPVANFNAVNLSGCPGLTVAFNNLSSLNAESFEWQFPGGNPATSTELNPTVTYLTFGNFDVLLITSNGFGFDTLIRPNYVAINTSGFVTAYEESFENGTLATLGWSVVNPDNANTWQKLTVQGTSPGNQAVGVNIFNNAANVGQRDRLISPAITLNQTSNNTLYFTHAHRRRSSNLRDSLIIFVSIDDGETFPFRIFGRAENGQGSFATGGLLNSNFVPTQTSDWCLSGTIGTSCLSVNLAQFDGQTIKLAFEVFNNGGNNIYLDNIQITGNCFFINVDPPIALLNVAKPTLCAGQSTGFTDISTNNPTFRSWSFEGGTPATSTQTSTTVTYNNSGVFLAQLISSNSSGSDTTTTTIEVFSNPIPPVITYNLAELSVNPNNNIQWFLNGIAFNPPTSPSFVPTVAGIYTAMVADENGCTSISVPYDLTALSIGAIDLKTDLQLFPNPSDNWVTIVSSQTISTPINLIDAMGRVIETIKPNNLNTMQFNTSHLSNGLYWFQNNNKHLIKLVVQH